MIERVGRMGPEESQTDFNITDEEVLALRHKAAGTGRPDPYAALREAITQPPTLEEQVQVLANIADRGYVSCNDHTLERARFEGMGQALRHVLKLLREANGGS